MSRKVIIFTYYWPPAGGVAVQRFLKFSKYLVGFGWEPIIVTVEHGSYPYYDQSLLKEIPESLQVYKTKTFEPFGLYNLLKGEKGKAVPQAVVDSTGAKSLFQRISEYLRANFFIPDARKGWKSYAIRQAEEILKNGNVDAIITTGPPHSAHLIGLELKEKYGLKWIADFRDPWTEIFYNKMLPRTKGARKRDLNMESAVLRNSDAVTVIGPGMKKRFIGKSKNLHILYNGYDDEDFGSVPAEGHIEDKFIIRYVGNWMGSENAHALWKAVANLHGLAGNEIMVEIVGRADADVKQSVNSLGLGNIVKYLEFRDHVQAIQLMQRAALLVLVIPSVPDNDLIITGKLFEYIGSGSEILGIGPLDGDAAEILHNVGRKPMLAYDDEVGVAGQLFDAYNYWKKGRKSYKYADDGKGTFTRQKQTGELAKILNSII